MTDHPIVGICTPAGETVDTDYALSLAAMVALTTAYDQRIVRQVAARKRQTIHRARNWLTRHMLKFTDPVITHLLWVDSDHVWPADTLIRLLAHGKDIVGCLHRTRMPPYHQVGQLMDGDIDPCTAGGLHEAVTLGHGLLLVSRKVYEAVEAPWYRETSDPSLAGTDRIDPDNVDGDISEDVYFCLKARQAGFSLWADLDLSYEVGHKDGSEAIMFRNPPPLPPYPVRQFSPAAPAGSSNLPIGPE